MASQLQSTTALASPPAFCSAQAQRRQAQPPRARRPRSPSPAHKPVRRPQAAPATTRSPLARAWKLRATIRATAPKSAWEWASASAYPCLQLWPPYSSCGPGRRSAVGSTSSKPLRPGSKHRGASRRWDTTSLAMGCPRCRGIIMRCLGKWAITVRRRWWAVMGEESCPRFQRGEIGDLGSGDSSGFLGVGTRILPRSVRYDGATSQLIHCITTGSQDHLYGMFPPIQRSQ